ncbi:glycoside hydrolase family 3 N-terminal domain-containing protein [Pseudidiomarina insulisalsae]|uniref:beta-N-acetylhexosaminidase n=1 Tax=Pseudidiomarina insulisalsae TaxID=575789 RepID=A0A432YPM9_9GAMM|nr:glycoside hydrolase family 3 N-terminal domain-containing protein [Pseudidiomarina insulisalsae]RUO63078.1 glycosyl hydrolase family 3 [Pseudidiomarina insulisalsae]
MRRFIVLLFSLIGLASCSPQPVTDADDVRHVLGQKLMLDFRYFCQDGTSASECKQAVTELPEALAEVLRQGHIGGVILFADNLETAPQIVSLIDEMQQVMHSAGLPPLFIAVDQEGGRVARLPASISTRFAGNMALGATYAAHGTTYAEQVAAGIAEELKLFGFNLNFAPTVDVNVNPDNPVINVRSYGEDAERVATLGQTTVASLQQYGIMSALKHFPGHGDTHVDSHTGLPRVDHDRATIDAVDLLPFRRIIASPTPPAMVMTAHIQYPQLDSTKFVATNGEPTIVPATMSRAILTGVLREQLGYEGIIVTDALDMAGIAHYFAPLEATVQTFRAGADIALMPYTLRTPQDIENFWQYFDGLIAAVKANRLDRHALQLSAQRIARLKAAYQLEQQAAVPRSERLAQLQQLPFPSLRQQEQELAQAAMTRIYDNGVLPLTQSHWQLVMPDTLRCHAFTAALRAQAPHITSTCLSLAALPAEEPWHDWPTDVPVIIGDITPHHSLAEMGGMDDLASWRERPSKEEQYAWVTDLLRVTDARQQPTVLVALRTPYVASRYRELADAALASYDYSAEETAEGELHSPSFRAIVHSLLTNEAPGQLPVSVD